MQPSGQVPSRTPWGKIAGGVLLAVVSFAAAIWAMSLFSPDGGTPASGGEDARGRAVVASDRRPTLAEVPPLKPVVRSSSVVTPVAIALTAIRDALEKTAPRDAAGKRDNP